MCVLELDLNVLELGLDVLELDTDVLGLDMDVLGLGPDAWARRPKTAQDAHRIPPTRPQDAPKTP